MPEKVLSNTQVYDSSLVNNIKDLCTDKAYKKSHSIVYTYNNEKKNLVLMHLLKILGVRWGIGFFSTTIIWNNDNDNKQSNHLDNNDRDIVLYYTDRKHG